MDSEKQYQSLPKDLKECEISLKNSLLLCLNKTNFKRISVELRFEGIKIVPIIFRVMSFLQDNNYDINVVFSDFGGAALARRDYEGYANKIYTFKEIIVNKDNFENKLFLVVSPQPFDYEEFVDLSEKINNRLIMFNGKLEETSIGVGYVGRERRSKFINSWINSYSIEPFTKGALLHQYPQDWFLFKRYSDGYRFSNSYASRPNGETIKDSIN